MSAQPSIPLHTPRAVMVDLDPTTAARWLEANTHNRNLRVSVVAGYARDMAAGRWAFTGEAIKFAADGTLLDGQHRCAAVIKSGVTIPVLVVNGLTHDTQDVMDSGAKRQAADALNLAGHKNSATLAAAARLALAFEAGRANPGNRGGSVAYTNSEVKDYVERHAGLVAAADAAVHYKGSIDAHPSVTAYVWWQLSAVSQHATVEFFESLANAQTNGRGDARAALIRRLATARRNNERLSQSAQVGLFFRAWNAWRKGHQMVSLPLESRSGTPIAIPVPR